MMRSALRSGSATATVGHAAARRRKPMGAVVTRSGYPYFSGARTRLDLSPESEHGLGECLWVLALRMVGRARDHDEASVREARRELAAGLDREVPLALARDHEHGRADGGEPVPAVVGEQLA